MRLSSCREALHSMMLLVDWLRVAPVMLSVPRRSSVHLHSSCAWWWSQWVWAGIRKMVSRAYGKCGNRLSLQQRMFLILIFRKVFQWPFSSGALNECEVLRARGPLLHLLVSHSIFAGLWLIIIISQFDLSILFVNISQCGEGRGSADG